MTFHCDIRILGVIDQRNSHVVHARGGDRSAYKPIVDEQSRPISAERYAEAIRAQHGIGEFYFADLDAIAGGAIPLKQLQQFDRLSIHVWADLGIGDGERAAEVRNAMESSAGSMIAIAGLESLRDEAALAEIVEVLSPERACFSLDLFQGRPWTRLSRWQNGWPLDVAIAAIEAGYRRLIVLDVAAVGTRGGCPTLALCRAIRELDGELEIITGGGIRGSDDLRALVDAQVDAALVGTALATRLSLGCR